MNNTTCICGNTKDIRAKQCRVCYLNTEEPSTKVCTKCLQEKTITEFRVRQKNSKPRPVATCRSCETAWYREHRKNNPGKALASKKAWDASHPEAVAAIMLRRKARNAGLDPVMVANHFDAHHGLCDICGGPPITNKALSIDHDHKTGTFRGLLCSPCNLGLGLFKDSPDRLTAAVAYLLNNETSNTAT